MSLLYNTILYLFGMNISVNENVIKNEVLNDENDMDILDDEKIDNSDLGEDKILKYNNTTDLFKGLFYLDHGEKYEALNNYEKMEKCYLLSINNNNLDASFNLFIYYYKNNMVDKLKEHYYFNNEQDIDNIVNLILEFKELKMYNMMLSYCLIAFAHKNTKVMIILGDYYFENEYYKSMYLCYKCAIDENNSDAMIKLGDFYFNFKKYDSMFTYYIMAIDNNNLDAILKLGNYYFGIMDYKNAITCYFDYFETFKNNNSDENINSDIIMKLGVCYESIEKYEIMKKYYNMAIKLNNSEAMFCLGRYYKYNKKYEQMFTYFLMAVERKNISAMIALYLYYCKINDSPKIIEYCLMILDTDFNNFNHYIKILYEHYEKINDYNNMIKYRLMVFEKNLTSKYDFENNKSELQKIIQNNIPMYIKYIKDNNKNIELKNNLCSHCSSDINEDCIKLHCGEIYCNSCLTLRLQNKIYICECNLYDFIY